MLAQRRAFRGSTVADAMAAVIRDEPTLHGRWPVVLRVSERQLPGLRWPSRRRES
jgi:hypothetical protein